MRKKSKTMYSKNLLNTRQVMFSEKVLSKVRWDTDLYWKHIIRK